MNKPHWSAPVFFNIMYEQIKDRLLQIVNGNQKDEVETVRNYVAARFGVPVERVFVTPLNGEYRVSILLELPMETLEMEVRLE